MTSVTLETLGLPGPRTRAGTPNHEDIMADLLTQLQEAQTAISNNLDIVADQIEILTAAVSSYNHLNPPAIPENPIADPNPNLNPNPNPNAKYEPKESFLGAFRGRLMFESTTLTIFEDHFDVLESFLISGGQTLNTDLVERYMFICCDKATKADYRSMKVKSEREGEIVEGVQGVLRCLRNTIRKRKPLHRIRSDYLAKHLHVQKASKFGKQGG